MKWKALSHIEQLESIIEESAEMAIVIFKHSTRCGISRMALSHFERNFDYEWGITAYYLDLLKYRSVSDEVSAQFGVPHQSPQIVVIRNGKAVYNASHENIDTEKLTDFVK